MNTFKKGDKVRWNGNERVVSSTEGSLVYFEHGLRPHHYEECTLVPADKFLQGDVVTNSISQHTIYVRDDQYGRVAYRYVDGSWDYESALKLISRPNDGVAELIRDGKYIEAIKQHRVVYGTGLKEAKDAVDAMKEKPATLGDILGATMKPKFKVGDKATSKHCPDAGVGIIESVGNRIGIRFPNWYGRCEDNPDDLILVSPPPAAIVIRFDKGAYEPNHTPRIHDSIESATKEAERLAKLNPGIAFHALAVSTISTATAPTVTTVRA